MEPTSLVTLFSIGRWVLGLLMVLAALTLLFKASPNRNQPTWKWLQTGTITAALLWLGMTALLGLYYKVSDQVSDTYGPLLGLIALMTWAYANRAIAPPRHVTRRASGGGARGNARPPHPPSLQRARPSPRA